MLCCVGKKKDPRPESLPTLQKRLVVVGDGACGKTCLLLRFIRGEFVSGYTPTMFETDVKEVECEGKRVQLILYDTAGQENYASLRPLSYASSDVIVICFDVMERGTLQNVEEVWAPEIRHCLKDIPIILVGNKKDLRHDGELRLSPPVSPAEGCRMAGKIGAEAYVECSSKTGDGVDRVFKEAVRAILEYNRLSMRLRRSFRKSLHINT